MSIKKVLGYRIMFSIFVFNRFYATFCKLVYFCTRVSQENWRVSCNYKL